MAKAFKCDICGKFSDDLEHKTEVRYRNGFYGGLYEYFHTEENSDLCPDCFKKLIAFSKSLIQEKEQKNNG